MSETIKKNTFIDSLNMVSEEAVKALPSKEVKGKVVRMREYNFVNPIKNRTSFKTFDSEVIESTEKIAMALQGRKVLSYAICRELSKLDNKEKLESMGFKNIGQYANALFDIATITGNQYARIGRYFINDNYEIKSDVLPSNLSTSHLLEFLKYVDEDGSFDSIEFLYLDGVLVDGMSTKKLRQSLKEYFQVTTVDGEANEVSEDTEQASESSEQEQASESSEQASESTEQKQASESNEQTQATKIDDKQVEVGKILSSIDNIMISFEKIFGIVGEESPELDNLANSFEFIKNVAKGYIA